MKGKREMLKVDETKVGEYENQITIINDALSKIESYHEELTTILGSGKWKGTSYDAFASVKESAVTYVTDLGTDYGNLKEYVNTLMTNVDEFATTSPVVKKLSE